MTNHLLMIDVSSNNGPVDVHALYKSGYRAIAVKATEGTDYVNPYYEQTVDTAHKLGMAVAHYHFPTDGSGVAQAQHFLATVRPHLRKHRDYLVLDMEPIMSGQQWTGDQPRLFTDGFLHALWDDAPTLGLLRRRVRRMVYGPPYFLRDNHIEPHHAERLWIASLGGSRPIFIPPGWRTWTAWQFTWSAHVPGVSGEVDESHIRPGVLRRVRAYPTLRYGATGPAVRLLQHLINESIEGHRLTVTGKFDAATKVRVNDVHHLIGNRRTGVAGPKVWRYLLRLPKASS